MAARSRVRVGGEWKQIKRKRVFVGGQWRIVKSHRVYHDGQWRTVFLGGPVLTVSASPPSQIALASGASATGSVVITPSGGVPPYSYSHSISSWMGGSIPVIANPDVSFAFITQALSIGETNICTFACLVTDSIGSPPGIASYEITFTRLEP